MRKNVNDWERVASVAVGAGILYLAARRQGAGRALIGSTGTGLISRGLAGYCPVNAALGRERRQDHPHEALSGSRGVNLRESIRIQAPVEKLFAFWRDLSNLPRVLPFIERVDQLDECVSHWVVQGPAGMRVEWDAEIINEIPFDTIAWESLPGADVASAGSVRFRPVGRGSTEVTVTMQYAPVAGKLGASVARLLGRSPGVEVRKALKELKRVMETGESSKLEYATGVRSTSPHSA